MEFDQNSQRWREEGPGSFSPRGHGRGAWKEGGGGELLQKCLSGSFTGAKKDSKVDQGGGFEEQPDVQPFGGLASFVSCKSASLRRQKGKSAE